MNSDGYKPTISTVMAQTDSKASYFYIAHVKPTRKGKKHKTPYVSQIPSANMAFRIEL